MKKFLILIMLCIGFTVSAQKLAANEWSYSYVGVATDTIGAGTTTWNKTVDISAPEQKALAVSVKVSDRAAGGAATVAFKGKVFSTDAYTTISTVTWTGVGSTDSIITYNSAATVNNYNYIQVVVTRTASTATINWLKLIVKK